MSDEENFFDNFWEASSLDRFNVQELASRLNVYDSDDKELLLEYPQEAEILPKPNTSLNKLGHKRKSTRNFSGKELSVRELGTVLSSFYTWNGLEHRGYPSAGATYATEIFCVAFNADKYTKKVFYYDAEKHGISVLPGKAPSWQEASANLNIEIKGQPNLLIIFVIFPERAMAKYGERGGRFALLEAGAALQQLSLQIAGSRKMRGVAVGGMLDEYWKDVLGLGRTDARIAAGYLVGK